MIGTGGVGIMVAEKWVEKVLEVKRVNARVIVLKLLFDKHILTVVSTYAPQIGLSEEKKETDSDLQQNGINSSLLHTQPVHQISSESVLLTSYF